MSTVLIVIHLLLAIGLVGVVLMQRSEGGGLGIGGGGSGNLMSGRSSGDLLTRTTAILAACFMASSLLLAVLAAHDRAQAPTSILDQLQSESGGSGEPVLPSAPLGN